MEKHLRAHNFDDVKLKVHSKATPAKTPLKSDLVKRSSDAAKTIYGVTPILWPMMPATGPMALFRKALDIPVAMVNTVSYVGSSYHAPDEHIYVEHYKAGIKHLAVMIAGYGNQT